MNLQHQEGGGERCLVNDYPIFLTDFVCIGCVLVRGGVDRCSQCTILAPNEHDSGRR